MGDIWMGPWDYGRAGVVAVRVVLDLIVKGHFFTLHNEALIKGMW